MISIQPKRESPVNNCNIGFIFNPVFRGFNKNLTDAQAMKMMFMNYGVFKYQILSLAVKNLNNMRHF